MGPDWNNVRHFSLLQFYFFKHVVYTINNNFHSESLEAAGWWVGLAPNIDHALTHKILIEDMHNITSCSAVHSLASTSSPNKHLDAFGGEDTTNLVVETHANRISADPNTYQAATFSSNNLIGATYLKDTEEDVDDKTFSHIKQEINPKIGILTVHHPVHCQGQREPICHQI